MARQFQRCLVKALPPLNADVAGLGINKLIDKASRAIHWHCPLPSAGIRKDRGVVISGHVRIWAFFKNTVRTSHDPCRTRITHSRT
jgi:hypothetical protein